MEPQGLRAICSSRQNALKSHRRRDTRGLSWALTEVRTFSVLPCPAGPSVLRVGGRLGTAHSSPTTSAIRKCWQGRPQAPALTPVCLGRLARTRPSRQARCRTRSAARPRSLPSASKACPPVASPRPQPPRCPGLLSTLRPSGSAGRTGEQARGTGAPAVGQRWSWEVPGVGESRQSRPPARPLQFGSPRLRWCLAAGRHEEILCAPDAGGGAHLAGRGGRVSSSTECPQAEVGASSK